MGVVVFDYTAWSTRYPELATSVAQPLAQQYFSEAQLYCDNTACSVIRDDSPGGRRAMMLNMLTAHIAALNAPLNNQASSPLVGRISNAAEGSVSVQTQNDYPPGSVQWYQSTKYGAAYWAAASAYRTLRYIPSCGRNMDPYNPWG